jgi:ParB family transcriptional regulator, chromosome partitioning protein
MASIKDLSVGRSDVYMIDPQTIYVDESKNCREDYGNIDELKDSIVASGLKNPLRGFVDGDKIVLTDGFRRMRAIKLAISEGHEIKAVKFLPEDRYSNEGDHLLTQIIANEGKPLTALEQSKVVKRLLQFGWSEEDIATRTGKTVQTIKNYLELSAASPAVHQMVAAGEVSATLATQVVKEHGSQATEVLTTAVETAKAAGKSKATAKQVKESEAKQPKPRLKTLIKMILDESKQTHLEEGVSLVIPHHLFNQLEEFDL